MFFQRFLILFFISCSFIFGAIVVLHAPNTPFFAPSKTALFVPDEASQEAKAFFSGALKQVGTTLAYDFSNGYYGNGGYPPEETGVCSDVIWRAYREVGVDFKKLLEEDIAKHPKDYENNLDPSINFRRVKNIYRFLERNGQKVTTQLIPQKVENLKWWQAGDIVIFEQMPANKLWHIGIVAPNRRDDGVPYMLDNHGQGTSVLITPLDWPTKIIWHYRYFPYNLDK